MFLTHLHADHTFALPDMHVMGWVLGRADPLEVHGPSGTTEMMTSMIRASTRHRQPLEERTDAQAAGVPNDGDPAGRRSMSAVV